MKPYEIVAQFKQVMAEFTKVPYAVAVESCSAAIFLCCLFEKVREFPEITVPNITYPSVPASIVNAGGRVTFKDIDWQKQGFYQLFPTHIIDSAKRLCRGMYVKNTLMCLSFHDKKALKIGRGGMILTDNKEAMEWFKIARFDGRHQCPLENDELIMPGWNMYMTPEQAARGLLLVQTLKEVNICEPGEYQDLSRYNFYTKANR